MKRSVILPVLLLLALGCLVYFTGCDLLGVSIDSRIQRFVQELNNSDRSSVYENFDPGITNYGGIQDPGFWDALFSYPNAPYNLTNLDSTDPLAVTGRITDSVAMDNNVKFEMVQTGTNWRISKMYMNPFPAAATTVIVD